MEDNLLYRKDNLNKIWISKAGNQLKLIWNINMSTPLELKIIFKTLMEEEKFLLIAGNQLTFVTVVGLIQ